MKINENPPAHWAFGVLDNLRNSFSYEGEVGSRPYSRNISFYHTELKYWRFAATWKVYSLATHVFLNLKSLPEKTKKITPTSTPNMDYIGYIGFPRSAAIQIPSARIGIGFALALALCSHSLYIGIGIAFTFALALHWHWLWLCIGLGFVLAFALH